MKGASDSPIRIAVAEDNGFLLRATLDKLEALGPQVSIDHVARNGEELLQVLTHDRTVDVVLMDLEMPRLDGIQATRLLKQRYPQMRVLVLTVFDDDDRIFRAIQAGADGYLLKEVTAEQLGVSLNAVQQGGAAMTPSIAAKTLRLLREPERAVQSTVEEESAPSLSKREVEVLEQIAQGLTYEAVAQNLFISAHTVRKHVENLYGKLHVHNKIEAAIEGRRRGLL